MKTTGIIREIDEHGRVVLPKEIRKTMKLSDEDSVQLFTVNHKIIMQKHEPGCIFCNQTEDLIIYKGKSVCEICLNKMDYR